MSGDLKSQPVTFTYLTENGPTTVNVSSLMPQTVYRYKCRCGCGKEFEAKGSDIQAQNTVPPQKVSTSVTQNGQIRVDMAQSQDQTGMVICTRHGHVVEANDLDDSSIDDSKETQDLTEDDVAIQSDDKGRLEVEGSQPVEEPGTDDSFDDVPTIGDRVWSKATGEGPFTIIAGTFIDVLAAKLEIADPINGNLVCERTRSSETLRLDAWLVKTQSNQIRTFPKPELTLERQHRPFSLLKVLLWLSVFSAFIALGWAARH